MDLSRTVEVARPAWSIAIRYVIASEKLQLDARAISQDGWKRYREHSRTLPHEVTVGGRVMVRLAALTRALYEAFRATGVARPTARQIVSRVNWVIFRPVATVPWFLTRCFSNDRLVRTRRVMQMFMRFPYASPGYVMGFVDRGDGGVACDVQRCAPADYFKHHDLAELCTESFCDLDYPLADIWKVRLIRPKTIAKGCDLCNFCFHKRTARAEQDACETLSNAVEQINSADFATTARSRAR
jgi:hypothetical protein